MFNGLKTSHKGIAGVLLAVLLAGCISLVALARQRSSNRSSKNAAKALQLTASAANAQAPSAKSNQKPAQAVATKPQVAAKRVAEAAKSPKPEAAQSPLPPAPPREIVLAPPVTPEQAKVEQENSDIGRARASWFFEQRAYPNEHIPEGALQKAIEQRDAMKAQQRAAAQLKSSANAIISFPGNALWQLMGPQPVNEPFSVNSGFPTASGRVTAVAVDQTDPTGNTVYIGGAAGGVWKTTNGGTDWTPLTDSQSSLAIGSITIDPNNHSTIYVGTGEENFNGDAFYGAGILKSTDGGTTWAQIGASTFAQVLGPNTGGAYIGQIAVQPGNSSIVLAAVSFFVNGTIGGIYRSADGGNTWAEDASPRGLAATSVVFESTSVASPTGAVAWAAMGNPFGEAVNGIYKSTDSGQTWTLQAGGAPSGTTLGRVTLAYGASTSGVSATLYAAVASSASTSSNLLNIFKTTNGGTSWAVVTGPAGGFCNSQCFYDMAVGVSPADPNFVLLGGGAYSNNSSTVFRSTNGGTSWTDITVGSTNVRPHVDTHAFGFNSSGGRFFVGNDGGMWRTDGPTATPPLWVNLNAGSAPGKGLAITQFYPGPSAGISDENYGFGGTQDNDTEVFSGTLDWTNVFACGDGGFTAIDPGIPTTVYTTCDRGAGAVVNKSIFNGAVINGPKPNFGAPFAGPNPTFNPADSGINHSDRMQFIPPLAIDDGNPNALYFGTFQVYQTTDGANTWNAVGFPSTDLTGGSGAITNLEVGHHASNLVVAGTSNGKVWETVNATSGAFATWTEIDGAPLPVRHVTSVRIPRDDTSGNTVYVTFSGFGSCAGCGTTPGHVFLTTNATTVPPTWTDISGNLPDIPVNDLIVSSQGNSSSDILYVGTDVGVFSCPAPTLTLCADWTVIGDGLPNSPVLGLAMRRPSRILRAATHGRSMWQIQLTDVPPPPVAFLTSLTPAAAFVGDPTTAVTVTGGNFSTNTLVLFDGVSVGTPTFVSTTQLTISVNSSLLTDGHVFKVSLTDPQGADTGSGPFTVMNPILNATGMSPSSTLAGVPVTLTFTGSNFVNSTAVTFNNFPLFGGTVTGGGTGFSVPVPVSLLITTGPATITITNPLPGGGPTPPASFPFTINPGTIIFNPNPITLFTFLGTTSTPATNVAIINTSASSAMITAQSIGGANAANFSFAPPTSGTTCNFPPTGQSGTGTVTLAANGGTCNFGITYTAANPPGNAVSNATLSVTDTASGSPQTAPIQGTPIATVFLAPVNFGPVTVGTTSPTMNATLSNFSGSSISVTSGFTVSGTNQADFHIVPFVPSSANPACPTTLPFPLASNASCDVTLTFTSSLPAGNETAQLNVTASVSVTTSTPNLIGTGIEVTSISPPIVATSGPAFTLTVNGGGFAAGAVVKVDGSARLTTFVSANELLASIPASDIATAGTHAITVTSGGTTSEPKTLFVAQAPSANNDNINFALPHRAGATTFRTASGPFSGGGNPVTLTWSAPFASTGYTAICTADVIPGIFSLPTITARTLTTITVVPAPGGTPSGIIACMAIPDTDTSTVRKIRVPISSASNVTVTWSPAFSSNAYAAVCSVESTSAGVFTSVISTFTPASIVVDNSAYASGTMHCIGIPKDGTYPSSIRVPKTPIAGSPQGVAVTFGVPFNGFTNDNTDYVAACSDVEPTVTSSTAALAILAGSKTVSGFTVINEIATGTLNCIAVPLGGSASSRYTEDTTQTTAQLAAITSPASLATPIDPIPSCAPGTATLQGRARSVWQVYTAPENGTAVADTRFSSYPTILSAWTISTALPSSSETFTQLACASGNVPAAGSSPVQSFVSFNVTKGTNYYLMVSDATPATAPATAPGGTLTFSIDAGDVAPPNDDNAAPIIVAPAQLPYSDTINSVLATANTGGHTDPTPPCAAGAASSGQANSVWYSFTPTSSGTITADTLTSPYETILNVTSGSPTGAQVACNASAIANSIAQSQVSFAATASTTYFFMVSSFLGDGGTTNFHLTFTPGAGAPAVTFSPTNVAFGNQKVATTSATTNVQLNNSGSATLNVTSITKTGTDPTQFAIVAPTSGTACSPLAGPFNLSAGISCFFGVQFAPTSTGAKSANVSVADNASGSPQTVPLTGTGAVPVASLAPANIAFPNQTINTSSVTNNVTISNTGQTSMNITSITLTGTNPTQFTLVAPTSGTACPLVASVLNAGNNCSVGVQFAPTVLGAQSANVSFADDAAGSPQTIPLTGTSVSAPAPVVTLAPTSISFGNQKVGTTSAVMSATLTNTGNANLNITGVSITGANAADFTSSGTTCTGTTVLAATQSCTLGATFTPSASGARAAAFTIADNAAGSPHSLPLSGTGTIPGVGLAPTSIAFGNQLINTSSGTTNVTLTNSGQASLNITSITLTGTDTTQFTLGAPSSGTACPLVASVLAAGANCAVGVKFAPTTTGAKSASVSFADDASGSPQTVPLTGTGTAPGITFAPVNIAFGNQRTGTSSATTNVVITNSGTATLNITSITLTGTNPTQFTLGAPTTGTACVLGVNAITAGNSCSVGVKFSPTNTGAQNANVSVADDAAGSPQTVPLTGTGTAPAVTFAPPNIAFGNQRTGTSTATTNVMITNSGTATLNITSITLTGANPTQFTLGAPTTGTACVLGANAITAGNNCSVGVKFSPTNTGAQSANVSVADDATGSPQTVPLTGTGTASAVTFAPTNVPFGNQVVSTQSAVTNVTITNSGTATLNITGITLTGANPGDFNLGAPTSGTACPLGASALNVGVGCNVGVSFSPTTTGARSANVSVADDAPGSPQTVPLTGTGTAANVTLAPSPVQFGTQRINTTTVTTTVTLTNSGNASVTLSTPTLSITGTNASDFAVVAVGTTCINGAVIAASPGPGNTCVIQLTFTPGALGARTAALNVADNAIPSPQSVTLNGTGTAPTAGVAPLNIPFGNQRKGTTSAGTDVTVSNTGTDKLTIASIALGGANPSQFVLGAPSSGTACSLAAATQVAPAANCKFSVKFAPTAIGAQAATVTITDDSGGTVGTIQTVTLSGTGTLPQASAAPNPLAFGNQRKGTTSAALTMTLTNTGTDTLNLAAANAVGISGANAADFAIVAGTTTCKNSTAVPPAPGPGNSCVINVTFTPSTTAAEAATLAITDDSGGVAGTVQNVSLTGAGVLPQGGAAPPTLAFGNQPKGVTSAALTATLTNSGSDTLNLAAANAVAISGANAADFAIVAGTTTCKNSTAVPPAPGPGNSCVVNVTFTPSTTAAEAATLTITDDSGGVAGTTQIVSLTGTGVTATVTFSPSPEPFGNQRVGTTSAALTMTLTNSGNGGVTLAAANAVTLSGGNVADFAITGGTCANSLALTAAPGPGNTCTVTATFTPSALGAENTTLTVTFQSGTPAATDNLTGTGVFPQAIPSPSPVNFNNQVITTTSAPMTVTLTNGGTDTLHLAAANAAVIGGANAGDFTIASGTTCINSATVAPGANCIINLTFTPSALNARTATLTITDDANPTAQVVTLNGTGTNPAPTITSPLVPASAIAGGATFVLTINGTNFVAGATVNFGANPALTPTTIAAGQIVVTVPATDIATAGAVNVTVTNPGPGGGTSAPAVFTVNNPVPTLTSIAPTSATAGGTSFTLTLTGTNFVAGSAVNFGSSPALTPTSQTATQIQVTVPAADIALAATLNVTVTNPAPGGGTSAPPAVFTVNNPMPTLTSIAPTSATAGGTSFTLTLTGTNFVAGSTVNFGANPALTPTSQTATQIQVTVPAADIATAGSVNVTVTNPAPGGGTTGAQTFTINNPVPTIASLAPTNATVGGAAFVLTVNGTNFVATSVVNFNGAARVTTFKSATQLTAAVLATDIVAAGVVNVTVTNPGPGGGTSAASPFTINNPQPVITSLSPSSTAAGGAAFTLTINGSSFVTGAKVDFGADKGLTSTFVTAAQIKVTIPAGDIVSAGTPNVVVNNPAPAVAPSAPSPFTVNNPVPTLATATAGGNAHISGGVAFVLTVTGTNFVSGNVGESTVVNFNGKAEPTTFVSATQVTAAVPATDAATAGTFPVTVTNPAPGGATTAAVNFTIDGFTLSGPATTTVKAGQQAMIQISVKPTANGFTNAVTSFSVSGLPAHTTFAFSPTSVTPNGATVTTTLTVTTIARGEVPPTAPLDTPVSPMLRLLPVLWLAALLAGLFAMQSIRRTPQLRRYAAIVPLALLLISGAVLAGCAGGKSGTPAGTSPLTITATSGSMVQSTPANSVALTVQ